MARKALLFLMLCVGLQFGARAAVTDAVHIILPYGMDTTCPGIQLNFSATHTNTTDTVVAYHWYTNNFYTGVSIDSFHTTAIGDGDSVYCWLVFNNGTGGLDSVKSNTIIIHRSSSFAPRVDISLLIGDNPGCAASLLTFTALPINGGLAPVYQWYINSTLLTGEDSVTMTGYFNAGDTIKVRMVSNSTCAAPFNDTVMSFGIPIIHDSLHATINIIAARNPICAGGHDTFYATTTNTGLGSSLTWYVNSSVVPLALGPAYPSDTVHNGDLVYVELNAPDPCVVNHTTTSNIITMTVISLGVTSATAVMGPGNNPGCLDSPVTFVGHYLNFGPIPPVYLWYVNGVQVLAGDSVLTRLYLNNDVVTYKVYDTSGGCFTSDTVFSPAVIMVRDSTPPQPLLSLIGDLLVVNNGGNFKWYRDSILIPGAINQTFHPTAFGNYYVIKDSAGCPSLPSNIIYIALTSVKNVVNGMVKVYPNPTTGILNLNWGVQKGSMEIEVLNSMGRLVRHEVVLNAAEHVLNLSALPPGEYFINLTDQDKNKGTFKISLTK